MIFYTLIRPEENFDKLKRTYYICAKHLFPLKIFDSIQACTHIKNTVVTLGMFDGVHLGHQSVIQQINSIAKEKNGESILLSFHPHPRIVLQKGAVQLLTTLKEKKKILEKAALQNLILHPFTKKFSQLSSTEFVRDYLVKYLNINTLVIGFDHHFGRNREGDFNQLSVLSKEFGFDLIQIDEIKKNGKEISSTKIRNGLLSGDLIYANDVLGYYYPLSGTVVHGSKLGRTLGFPTANLEVEAHKLIPKQGVYAVKVNWEGKSHIGLLSIGIRATIVETKELRVEVHLLDFEGDLYGKMLDLELLAWIRDEEKFNSIDDLVLQMKKDEAWARKFCKI